MREQKIEKKLDREQEIDGDSEKENDIWIDWKKDLEGKKIKGKF